MRLSTLDECEINIRLANLYGRYIDGRPTFRLVFNDERLTEKRKGEFEIYNDDGSFKETYNGVLEVQKYPDFPHCYILEKIQETDDPTNQDRVTYEPLYSFVTKSGQILDFNWRVIEVIIHDNLNRDKKVKKTKQDFIDEDNERLRKEKERNLDIIKSNSPHIANKLRDGEAIVVPDMSGVKNE